MEKIYKPAKFNASEKINLKEVFASFAQFKCENVEDEEGDRLVFDRLKIDDELEQHRLITDCSIDLLNADEEQDEVQDQARHLDTVRVREVYKASFRDIYIQHRFHKNICRNDTPAADTSAENDLQPGADLAVSFRIYHPFRFIYSTSSSRKIKTNSRTNLKFSHEIVALGSNTLAELRDRIWCSSDHRWCVEIDDAADKDRSEVNPKTVYPSGFFFIDDTFYNDLRDAGSFDYSEIIRQWAQERDIAPLHVSCMSKVRVNELTPRFGYPYVYLHQGNCEHVIVISDAWVLSANDSLSSKQYPTCSGMHQSYTKLCHVCGIESARWICVDSDRLPQDRMLFCDTCFRSYNYNDDGSKIGSFKAYPCIHTNIV